MGCMPGPASQTPYAGKTFVWDGLARESFVREGFVLAEIDALLTLSSKG
jgi:hypothetical protein